MASIATLPIKTLIKVLKQLRGGEIGFDPYRDPRTSRKESLLAFIIKEHTNEQIIDAIHAVEEIEATTHTAEETPDEKYYVRFNDANGFECVNEFDSERAADLFIKAAPYNHYLGKMTEPQYKTWVATTLANEKKNFIYAPTIIVDEAPTSPMTSGIKSKKNAKQTEVAEPTSEATQLALLLASMTAKAGLDEKRVKDLISAQAFEDDWVTRTEVKEMLGERAEPVRVDIYNPATQELKHTGVQHHKFPLLLKACQARLNDGHRLNVWLKGPAGSGKTTACEKVAEALGLAFSFNGAIESKYDLIGFIDAGGRYHGSAFRQAFEFGGVHLFDEFDASAPAAVNCFNAATANGIMSFPDKIVKRHADCVLIAGANTAGVGANSDYVGRFKQDAAALDRYVYIDWPIDEALETALCQNSTWVRSVQKMRKRAHERGIKNHMITPRATLYGAALLAAGIDLEDVEALTLRKGLTDEVWGQIQ